MLKLDSIKFLQLSSVTIPPWPYHIERRQLFLPHYVQHEMLGMFHGYGEMEASSSYTGARSRKISPGAAYQELSSS